MAGSVGVLLRFVQSQTIQAQSDAELLRGFAERGDQRAFAELVQRYGPFVLGICRRIVRDSHEAEDAFQATFLLLSRKAASLRQPDRLAAWLHAVACRIAGKALRRGWRRGIAFGPEHDLPMPVDTDGEAVRELRPILDEAIRALPAKYREPVILCYLQGLTNADVARRLGCPLGTVATRLSRARDQLRSRLVRRGVVLPAALFPLLLSKAAVSSAAPINLCELTAAQVAGPAAAGITQLIEGIGKTMLVEKSRWLAAAFVVLSACTVGLVSYHSGASEPARPAVKPADSSGDVPKEKPSAIAVVNFIVQCEEPRSARVVAEMAELQRKRIAEQWFGKELPKWAKPCEIQVRIKREGARGATTISFPDDLNAAEQSLRQGYLTWHSRQAEFAAKLTEQEVAQVRAQFEAIRAQRIQALESVIGLSMFLEGPLDGLLADALPREVTHAVMATHFGKPLPRWADEGIAMMSESHEERARHSRQALERVANDGAMRLKDILPRRDFPDHPLLAESFRAQGYSLAEFLVEHHDRATLLRFVKDGMEGDWNKAAAMHYNFRDIEQMEFVWRQWLDEKATPILRQDPTKRGVGEPLQGEAPTIGRAVAGTFSAGTGIKINVIRVDRTESYSARVTSYAERTTDGVTYYVPVTAERNLTRNVESSYSAKDVKAFELDGTPIETAAVLQRLKKETPVLLSAGSKVDPFYLQMIKAGTMILVIPGLPAIQQEGAPSPAVPYQPAIAPPTPIFPNPLPTVPQTMPTVPGPPATAPMVPYPPAMPAPNTP
jgi:RNA polymerase sigma factor (sigma-70 family)